MNKLWYGGDYNPEQWPRDVWDADARLMDEARWNVATVGVFSWVSLEPEEGRYTFDWLGEILDRLDAGGRQAILATPSASPPAWMSQAYPEIRRVGPDGVRQRHGNRVNYCLTSLIYRQKCRQIAFELAQRFGRHPALALWHVSNEYGGACHCDLCAEAFRQWLRTKFEDDLDRLNHAYWTSFWGHTFTDWSQIEIPGPPHGETAIQGLSLDWRRFLSDQTIYFYRNEAAPLREATPEVAITTNFMGFYGGLDYWKFAQDIDIASWDSYPAFDGPLSKTSTWVSVAMKHDLTRSMKRGKPFLLMECTPSASNWYPEMELKRPGVNRLEGIQAVAHGSDSVQYFQWRQSRGGQEKFHGAAVGHDGTNQSRVFREVADLGRTLEQLAGVAGTTVQAEVAIVYDWESTWAIEGACGPRQGPRGYLEACRSFYEPLLIAGVPVDFVPSDGDLKPYRLVVAPMLHLIKPGVGEALETFVRGGGSLVATYWTGIVDENDLCFLGGFPGGEGSALRRTLGIWSEELDVLYPGETRLIESDERHGLPATYLAHTFCDLIHAETAEVLARYADGFYAGRPTVTVNRLGNGRAFYIASRNDPGFHEAFVGALVDDLSLRPALPITPDGVIARRRGDYLFLLNLTDESALTLLDEGLWIDAESGSPKVEVTLAPFSAQVLVRSEE
jgi:beta-galactosidase